MQDGVRFAVTDEENEASYRLRYKIYVESMGRLKEKGDHERKVLQDVHDKSARALIAIQNGETVGTLRLFWGGDTAFSKTLIEAYHLSPFLEYLKQNQICIVERMMVLEKFRGSMVTLRLYKEVMHFVLKHQAEVVLLDCEPHHLNSYLKLGFRPFTSPYTYPGIGLVIPMALITGDYEHLKSVGSPFASLTKAEDLLHCEHVDELLTIVDKKQNILSHSLVNKAAFLDQIHVDQADEKISFSTKFSVLDSLNQEEIEHLIEKSHIIDCEKGDHIIEEDNSAKTMFILLSGFVEVQRNNQLVAVISPGEVIGEIAFFLGIPRTASIIAASDHVRVLSLDERALSRLLKQENPITNKLLMSLCKGLCSRIIKHAVMEN